MHNSVRNMQRLDRLTVTLGIPLEHFSSSLLKPIAEGGVGPADHYSDTELMTPILETALKLQHCFVAWSSPIPAFGLQDFSLNYLSQSQWFDTV